MHFTILLLFSVYITYYHLLILPNPQPLQSVHLRIEEKINLTGNRDGGIESMELQGFLMLTVNDEKCGHSCINITNNDTKSITLQVTTT